MCCGRFKKRRGSSDSYSSIGDHSKMWPLWKMILVWGAVSVIALVLLVFILIFVGFPVTFWLCYPLQRLMIFSPTASPENPAFNDPLSYGIQGVRNFYITVPDYYNSKTMTKIGAWLILQESDIKNVTSTDIQEIIANTNRDILFYLHGVAANRAKATFQYSVFRKYFMVIAIDHRGYGDSGQNVELTEEGIVSDHVYIYDWLKNINSNVNIYYWGHSLGSAITCHTMKALYERRSFTPMGVVLESPFSTIEDEIRYFLGRFFKWLAYFEATMVRPVGKNGIHFASTTNILKINCPIMILNAEDDNVIPWTLGQKLAKVAQTERNVNLQGDVKFIHFPASKGYGHNDITTDPSIPTLIEQFKYNCTTFKFTIRNPI